MGTGSPCSIAGASSTPSPRTRARKRVVQSNASAITDSLGGVPSSTTSIERSMSAPVEREVQREDVDPRLAKEAELPTLGVLRDELADGGFVERPGLRHPRHLVEGGGGTDVRVETAAGRGHEIDGHR